MNTLIAKTLLKKAALMFISRKINDNIEDKQKSDFHPKELVKAVPAWAAIATFIVYLASSLGYIDQGLANAINVLVSNPEVVEAVEVLAD